MKIQSFKNLRYVILYINFYFLFSNRKATKSQLQKMVWYLSLLENGPSWSVKWSPMYQNPWPTSPVGHEFHNFYKGLTLLLTINCHQLRLPARCLTEVKQILIITAFSPYNHTTRLRSLYLIYKDCFNYKFKELKTKSYISTVTCNELQEVKFIQDHYRMS